MRDALPAVSPWRTSKIVMSRNEPPPRTGHHAPYCVGPAVTISTMRRKDKPCLLATLQNIGQASSDGTRGVHKWPRAGTKFKMDRGKASGAPDMQQGNYRIVL